MTGILSRTIVPPVKSPPRFPVCSYYCVIIPAVFFLELTKLKIEFRVLRVLNWKLPGDSYFISNYKINEWYVTFLFSQRWSNVGLQVKYKTISEKQHFENLRY